MMFANTMISLGKISPTKVSIATARPASTGLETVLDPVRMSGASATNPATEIGLG